MGCCASGENVVKQKDPLMAETASTEQNLLIEQSTVQALGDNAIAVVADDATQQQKAEEIPKIPPKLKLSTVKIGNGFAELKVEESHEYKQEYAIDGLKIQYYYDDENHAEHLFEREEDTKENHIEMKERFIPMSQLASNNQLAFKISQPLHDYKFYIRICSVKFREEDKALEENKEMSEEEEEIHRRKKEENAVMFHPYSDMLWCHVPFESGDTEWKIGDYVQFQPSNKVLYIPGEIIEILTDDEEQQKIYRIRPLQMSRRTEVHEAPKLKMTRIEIPTSLVVDISDQMIVDRNLLLLGRGKECEAVYQALCSGFVPFTQPGKFRDKFADKSLQTRMIALQVLDFVFAPAYQWRLGCNLCSQKFGRIDILKCSVVWSSTIDAVIDVHRVGDTFGDIHNLQFMCDICTVVVNPYDFGYTCQGKDLFNRHVLCLPCMNKNALKHQQVLYLLNDILDTVLNRDCIFEIVSFVVGIVTKNAKT